MKEDLVPRTPGAPCGQDVVYIPRERPELEETVEHKQVVLSMEKLSDDRKPVPRPYQDEE